MCWSMHFINILLHWRLARSCWGTNSRAARAKRTHPVYHWIGESVMVVYVCLRCHSELHSLCVHAQTVLRNWVLPPTFEPPRGANKCEEMKRQPFHRQVPQHEDTCATTFGQSSQLCLASSPDASVFDPSVFVSNEHLVLCFLKEKPMWQKSFKAWPPLKRAGQRIIRRGYSWIWMLLWCVVIGLCRDQKCPALEVHFRLQNGKGIAPGRQINLL